MTSSPSYSSIYAFALALVLPFCLPTQIFAASLDFDTRYKKALEYARNGKYTPALAELKYLLGKAPDKKAYRHDYIQVLGWANRNDEVLEQSQYTDLSQSPTYVTKAVARAARNLGKFQQAERLLRNAQSRFPKRIEIKVALALVLIDQENSEAALELLRRLQIEHPQDVRILSALAYAYEANDTFVPAYAVYQKILTIKPNHRESLRGMVFALRKAGAIEIALNKAQPFRSLFSDEDWARLHADVAAYKVRWGEISPISGKHRYDDTDAAIKNLHNNSELLDRLKLSDPEDWSYNAQFDLMLALRDKKQMVKVVDHYRDMDLKSIKLPAYAEIAVADAFLYLEQPEKARDLYLSALAKEPESFNANLSLVFAYVETEQHDEAIRVADQLAAAQRPRLYFHKPESEGLTYATGNQYKTDSELVAAMTRSFADYLADAQFKLESMHDEAPFNTGIRTELSNLYSRRGWRRRALREYEIGTQIEPEHLGSQTGLSDALLELRHFREAEKRILNLAANYPEHKNVQYEKKLLDVHNDRELKVFTEAGTSNGAAQGSEHIGVEAYLFSAPIDYNYRLFLHSRWRTGIFDAGRAYARLYGLGVEYAIPDILFATELHYDDSAKDVLGLNANLSYDFDDQWRLSTGFDTRSGNIPLEALINGITGKSGNLILQYRAHESRTLKLSTNYLAFSDGNDRISVTGSYFERWITGPIYKFATILNLGYSDNSKETTPYFNPQSDFFSSLTLDNDWLSYRRYDLSFNQKIAITVGNYQQQNFGSSIVGNIRYEHRWQADERFGLDYGATRNYQVFDGVREEGWEYYLNLNLRF